MALSLQQATQIRRIVRATGKAREAYQAALKTPHGGPAWQNFYDARDAVRQEKGKAIDAGVDVPVFVNDGEPF